MCIVSIVLATIFETVTLLLMQHSIFVFVQLLRMLWVSRTHALEESDFSLMACKMKDADTEEAR